MGFPPHRRAHAVGPEVPQGDAGIGVFARDAVEVVQVGGDAGGAEERGGTEGGEPCAEFLGVEGGLRGLRGVGWLAEVVGDVAGEDLPFEFEEEDEAQEGD